MARWSQPVAVALALSVVLSAGVAAQQSLQFPLLNLYLESLRRQLHIPGLSALVLNQGRVVWEAGYGHADVEAALPALPDTPYNIADLTQTFSAILLAECAEAGKDNVAPNEPIVRWVPQAPIQATLAQLMSHTSGPTTLFNYNSERFALLTSVVEACMERPYRIALKEEIFDYLGMTDAVPGRDLSARLPDGTPMFEPQDVTTYAAILRRAAVAYKVDRRGGRSRSDSQPTHIDAAGGAIASARDLARFDGALVAHDLIRDDTLADTWKSITVNGVTQPTTMGWFAQTYQGERLIWHFGLIRDAYSALILKVPARGLTLILLANSDGLSAEFSLHAGDVTSSPFAQAFLKLFIT